MLLLLIDIGFVAVTPALGFQLYATDLIFYRPILHVVGIYFS